MTVEAPYVSRKDVERQYRPSGYGLSPGLQRAREPFRLRNALTGVILGSFAVGIWAYSIRAVKQDNFEDVDEEARALLAAQLQSSENSDTISPSPTTPSLPSEALNTSDSSNRNASTANLPSSEPVRGVLASFLDKKYPNLLDPQTKTLVWGAPPVDRIGRLSDVPRG